jgi:hypothetical protein
LSTSFIITVKEANQHEVDGALLYAQRYYPGTGQWETVAMGITDIAGTAPLQFESETEDYRILVIKNNVVLYTSPMQKMYCTSTPCTLALQIASNPIATWIPVGNLSNMIYTLTFNQTTKLITYQYVDTSGTTSYGRLWVYKIDAANGKQTVCNINSTSNAAILNCNVTNQTGTVYAEAYISRSPEVLGSWIQVIIDNARSTFGMEGLLWAGLIILTLAIIGISVGGVPVGIVFTLLGFIVMGLLGIASFGAVLIGGIVIVGMIILWIIKQ